jgi:hypothetical protein
VPTGRWFQLKVDTCGNRAAVSIDGQSPLVVERLARPVAAGQLGVWTFRPAYFCDLRVSACERLEIPSVELLSMAEGVVGTWFVEGYGVVACEPSGAINLNRYLPPSVGKARLVLRFELSEESEITFEFGFSDDLSLELDGDVVYKGENTFAGFADRAARGYVEMGMESVRQVLSPGSHHVVAELAVSEGFGWGLVLAARGTGLLWLPAALG